MSTNSINRTFIDKVKSLIEDTGVESLMEILSLSKEAVYRRLRGDVQLSYPEAVIVSQALGISLDELTFGSEKHFVFQSLTPPSMNPEKVYQEMLKASSHIFDNAQSSQDAHAFMASSSIPFFFIGDYEHLFRFHYYSLQHNKNSANVLHKKLGEVQIPEEIQADVNVYLNSFWNLDTTFVLSESMFENYLKTLKYFFAINLIGKSELEHIKSDLYSMVDHMEEATTSGISKSGSQLTVYLSDIHIESSWGYLQSGTNQISFSRLLASDYAVSYNSDVCRMYRDSINHLKKYASLISQSGSAQRTEFFRKQRLLIKERIN